jgi:hypothetical protein
MTTEGNDMTSIASFGSDPATGIRIDMARVPSSDTPAAEKGSHLRSTGRGYVDDDGTVSAQVEIVSGPRRDA